MKKVYFEIKIEKLVVKLSKLEKKLLCNMKKIQSIKYKNTKCKIQNMTRTCRWHKWNVDR